jgi:hypothetical protein
MSNMIELEINCSVLSNLTVRKVVLDINHNSKNGH